MTPLAIHSAVTILLIVRLLDTSCALEKTSAVVRRLLFMLNLTCLNLLPPPVPGYQCFRDSAGNPGCKPPTTTTTVTNNPGTTTVTNDSPGTDLGNPTGSAFGNGGSSQGSLGGAPTPTPSGNGGPQGASSSALSVVVNVLRTLFVGACASVFLF